MTSAGEPDQPDEPNSHTSFPLQPGESVLRVYRRHWLYLWPNILMLILVAFVPPAIIAGLLSTAGAYEGTAALVFWVIAGVWIVVWLVRAFLAWYRYHHDTWILTSQRLIDSYRRHPFSMRMSTADLVNVQDMTVLRDGILRTAFDYGDIICQTAADEQKDFHLSGIPHPREALALVDRERDRERAGRRAGP
jgi:hypothetical protein